MKQPHIPEQSMCMSSNTDRNQMHTKYIASGMLEALAMTAAAKSAYTEENAWQVSVAVHGLLTSNT